MDEVADDEILYRRVLARSGHVKVEPDGTVHATSLAFSERHQQTSVFRALLCRNNATYIQDQPTDGVASLITVDVRNIALIGPNEQRNSITYLVDVLPDPLQPHEARPEIRAAHAIIVLQPAYCTDKTYKRLLHALARLASQRVWIISPHFL